MRGAKPMKAMVDGALRDAAIDYFCARSHNAWRRTLLRTNPEQRGRQRMRMRGGVMVDVNQPWSKLHPNAKAENGIAAADALAAIAKFPRDREAAADYVHKCWIKRNKRDPSQPKELFAPYRRLTEVEKDKDRAHVDMIKAAVKAVSKRASKAPQKPKRDTQKFKSVKLPVAAWTRLERAAAALSARTGRKVSAEMLLRASLDAMVAVCGESAGQTRPKPRRR